MATPLDRIVAHYTRAVAHQRDIQQDDIYEAARQRAGRLLSLLDLKQPARILDLACGTGITTAAFAEEGHDVTGLDCTPAMLAYARALARRGGHQVRWTLGDIRALPFLRESFDAVLLRDVVFGIFASPAEDMLAMREMARVLALGGKCLFEVYNKEFARYHGIENTYAYDAGTDRFTVAQHAEGASVPSIKVYARQEWHDMFAQAGLELTAESGWSLPGDPSPPPHRVDLLVVRKL